MQFERKYIKYNVIKEKRMVEAMYPFDFSEATNEVENIFGKCFSGQHLVTGYLSLYPVHPTIKLIVVRARCHPDDDFNIQKGMEICYHRLLLRFYEEKHRVVSATIKSLTNAVDRLNETLTSLECGHIKVDSLICNGSFDTVFAQYENLPEKDLLKALRNENINRNTLRDSIVCQKNKEALEKNHSEEKNRPVKSKESDEKTDEQNT